MAAPTRRCTLVMGRVSGACARAGWLGLMVAMIVSCSGGGDARPNIVLITVDTLRPDRLTPYGYEEIETPAVAALAESGIVFENAFCNVTWTIPSMASVMTGLYDFEHGVQTPFDRLEGAAPTLAELLRRAGYYTAAIVASYPLDRRFGFDRGFATYSDDTTAPLFAPEQPEGSVDESLFEHDRLAWYAQRAGQSAFRSDAAVVDEAIAWIERKPVSPFFLWVHLFGPHARGTAERTSAEYDRDVVATDRELGRFLNALRRAPWWKRTMVVFHADHGETIDEHRAHGHGRNLHDSAARVPIIIRLPGDRRAGERVGRLVRNLDVFATALRRAGIEPPGSTRGRDLLDPKDGQSESTYLATYMIPLRLTLDVEGKETEVGFRLRGIRTEAWKLVVLEPVAATPWSPHEGTALPATFVEERRRVQLYDLQQDPNERIDVAKQRPEVVRELLALLQETEASGTVTSAPRRALDPDVRRQLEKLGYIESGGGLPPVQAENRADDVR